MTRPVTLRRSKSALYDSIDYGSQPHMERLYSMDLKYMVYCIKREGWAFIFICGYLFFEYVRPQSMYPWMDVLPWPALFIILAFLALLADSGRKVNTAHPLNKLMVLYGVVVLASVAASEYPNVSLENLRKYSDWLIVYFLIVKIINTRTRFFIFFLSFLIYSFKMSQHGFLSWASRGFAFTDWGVTGAPGWFHNSGEVGIQMALYTPMAFMFVIALRQHWNKWWRAFFYFMPISGVGTIIASSSRGAMVGLAAAGAMALYRTKYFFRTILFIAVGGALVWTFVPDEFKTRFDTAGDDRTSLHRLERWEHGWETMKEKPILGVGHSAWETYYPGRFVPEHWGSRMVHNVFIQAGTELGFTGLLVFIALILTAFISHNRIRKKAKKVEDRFYYLMTFGLDMGLVGLIISASFVTVLYYPYFWIFFAITAAFSNSFETQYPRKVPSRKTRVQLKRPGYAA